MKSVKSHLIATVIGAAIVGGFWLYRIIGPRSTESQVIVRDGSIDLLAPDGPYDLNQYLMMSLPVAMGSYDNVNRKVILYPRLDWSVLQIQSGGTNSTCNPNEQCWVTVVYASSTGSPNILVLGTGPSGKGLWIFSSQPFTSPPWAMSAARQWKIDDPNLKIQRVLGNKVDGQSTEKKLCELGGGTTSCGLTLKYGG